MCYRISALIARYSNAPLRPSQIFSRSSLQPGRPHPPSAPSAVSESTVVEQREARADPICARRCINRIRVSFNASCPVRTSRDAVIVIVNDPRGQHNRCRDRNTRGIRQMRIMSARSSSYDHRSSAIPESSLLRALPSPRTRE